ncbi:hypothetical protein [Variovorax sp. Sphag1AA]|uniref:hypothetical protein n=1 Tax=Variovorax sp. Sphag1AA TaxID=2587027 RepID=UPI00161B47EC|nr:hypothetical protein [Variovorax sp. Sphag1AA]MBB3182416.1 hypothetical protein [Variovorax sp. Sphag1AA]
MKFVHIFSLSSVVAAVVLLVAGASGAAAGVFALGVLVEIIGSALTGKQSNEGMR